MQVLTLGMERVKDTIVKSDRFASRERYIPENDATVRAFEGLTLEDSIIFGKVPEKVVIEENDVSLREYSWRTKTGHFLDQRCNRIL